MEIIPAILETSFEDVIRKIRIIEGVTDMVQIDLVDGVYVNGLTFLDVERINELDTTLNIELDLLVVSPLLYIGNEIKNVKRVCAHVENFPEIDEFISVAKSRDWEVGLSLAPETSYDEVVPYLNMIDYVQFMTIHPGKQGSPFVPEVPDKIKEFTKVHPTVMCQADGSIGPETIRSVAEAGVSRFVVGSHIFGSADPVEEYLKLKKV